MKFLTFIKTNEKDRDKPIPQALNDAMGPFVGAAMASRLGNDKSQAPITRSKTVMSRETGGKPNEGTPA